MKTSSDKATELLSQRIRDLETSMNAPKTIGCRVYSNVNVTISTGVYTPITFTHAREDTYGMVSLPGSVANILVDGWYMITGCVDIAANATGLRRVRIRIDGATYISSQGDGPPDGVSTMMLAVSVVYKLAAGQYVELVVFQNSGGDLNVIAATNESPELSVLRVG